MKLATTTIALALSATAALAEPLPVSFIDDPGYWRQRAQEARALADQINDSYAKVAMRWLDHEAVLQSSHLSFRTYRSLSQFAPLYNSPHRRFSSAGIAAVAVPSRLISRRRSCTVIMSRNGASPLGVTLWGCVGWHLRLDAVLRV
jgi:hypothetical protein